MSDTDEVDRRAIVARFLGAQEDAERRRTQAREPDDREPRSVSQQRRLAVQTGDADRETAAPPGSLGPPWCPSCGVGLRNVIAAERRRVVEPFETLAAEYEGRVKPRSLHPAGTHADGSGQAYADAAHDLRAVLAQLDRRPGSEEATKPHPIGRCGDPSCGGDW